MPTMWSGYSFITTAHGAALSCRWSCSACLSIPWRQIFNKANTLVLALSIAVALNLWNDSAPEVPASTTVVTPWGNAVDIGVDLCEIAEVMCVEVYQSRCHIQPRDVHCGTRRRGGNIWSNFGDLPVTDGHVVRTVKAVRRGRLRVRPSVPGRGTNSM